MSNQMTRHTRRLIVALVIMLAVVFAASLATALPSQAADGSSSPLTDGVCEPGIVRQFVGHGHNSYAYGDVTHVMWSPDGRTFLTIGMGKNERELFLWDLEDENPIQKFSARSGLIHQIAWSPNSQYFTLSNDRGQVYLWKVGEVQPVRLITGNQTERYYVAWSGDSQQLVVASSNDLFLVDLEQSQPIRQYKAPGTIFNVIWGDATHFITVGRDADIYLWDVEQVDPIRQYSGQLGDVYSVTWNADGKHFLTANNHGEAFLWDKDEPKPIRQFEEQAHGSPLKDIKWNPDGKRFVTVNDKGDMFLWDKDQAQALHQYKGAEPKGLSYHIDWSPDGQQFISGGSKVFLWNVDSEQPIWEFPPATGGPLSMSWNSDGRSLAVTGMNGQVFVWNVVKLNHLLKALSAQHVPLISLACKPISAYLPTPAPNYDMTFTAIALTSDQRRETQTAQQNETRKAAMLASTAITFTPSPTIPTLTPTASVPIIYQSATALAVNHQNGVPSAGATPTLSSPTTQGSADEARSLYWAAEAQNNFDHGDPFTAYALAIQANSMPNPPPQAQRALNNIAYEPGPRSMMGEHLKDAIFTANWRYMFSISVHSEITMWDTMSDTMVRHFVGPDEYLNNIVLSPDERSLLTVGWEGQMLIWDVATGKETHRIAGNGLSSLAEAKAIFSPDGSKVVTFDNGPDIRVPNISLWDVITGQELGRFPGSDPQFSPDGNLLLITSGYSANDSLELWDVATGQKIRSLNDSQHSVGTVSGATFSPNGKRIVSYGDKLVLWDVKTGAQVNELKGHDPNVPVHNAVFSPDGRLLVSSDEGGGLIVWNMDDQTEKSRLNGYDSGVEITFSADGHKMLTESAHYIGYCADCPTTISQSSKPKLLLWDTQFFSLIHDYSRQKYDLNRGEFESVTIDKAQLSPDGEHVATMSDGAVTLWDTENGQILHDFTGQNPDLNALGFDQSLHGMVYSPDRQYGITMSNGNYDSKGVVILYDLKSGKPLLNFDQHKGPIRSVAFSPDGQSVVSGSTFGEMIQWDLKTRQIVRRFEGQTGDVMALAFSPDGRTILSAASDEYSGDPELVLWDVATGKEIRRFIGHNPLEMIHGIAFSPDGRTILSGAGNDTLDSENQYDPPDPELILWDVATGKEIRRFIGHLGYVFDVAFSPDGRHILSYGGIYGGQYEQLYLWDVVSGAIINRFPISWPHIRHISFSDDGHSIVSINDNDEIIIWRADSVVETIQWLLGNRVVPAFTCEQRQFYNIAPLCVGDTLPELTPFPTALPSPTANLTLTTATLTQTVTPTVPTVTPSLTPTIPTATPTLTPTPTSGAATLEAQRMASRQAIESNFAATLTERANILMTATAVTYTPSPTFNPNDEAVVGSQRDNLVPPKWKVWRYHGTAGEVVTIRVKAEKDLDNPNAEVLLYPYFVLHGPNGALLETVNGIEAGHEDESVLQNYILPATGVYEIEVRSRGLASGSFTLVIESLSITILAPTARSSPPVPTRSLTATFDVGTLTAEAATDSASMALVDQRVKQTATALHFERGQTATITLTASPTASAMP